MSRHYGVDFALNIASSILLVPYILDSLFWARGRERFGLFRTNKQRFKFYTVVWGVAVVSDVVDYVATGALIDVFLGVMGITLTLTFYRKWKKHKDDDDDPPLRKRAGVNLLPKPRIARAQLR